MTLADLLLRLLEKLESIGQENEEIFDTEVRERIGIAIMEGFVRQSIGYEVPADLGMASEEGNQAVHAAITEYVEKANATAGALGITKFHDRLAAFQDATVRTRTTKSDYEEFFGHTPPEFYDEHGTVIRTQ